ncbi:hypothetical protein SFHH103_psfHH103d_230 (plasmid) [Sinorhizobium fredii HH103]|nr:hypothetical protein SFHH103_04412 [Sinorhizobium fredii HH103]CEO91428.1 hypothetical protein SFHH103_psfHH103d_230 [Sinorhizobium fredii HH103]
MPVCSRTIPRSIELMRAIEIIDFTEILLPAMPLFGHGTEVKGEFP